MKLFSFILLFTLNSFPKIHYLKGKTLVLEKDFILKSNDQIIGPGKIRLLSNSNGVILKGNNIKISNVKFSAENNHTKHSTILKIEDGASNINISDNSFLGNRYTILKADINTTKDRKLRFKNRASNIVFSRNNCFEGFSRHLYLSSIENIKITDNHFEESLRDSIRLRQNIKKIIISNNSFKNIGVISKESSDGIDSYWSGEDLIITNNRFDNIATHALDIKGISPDLKGSSSKVIISNNMISSCQYSGIVISSGAKVSGKENYIKDVTITSNQIRNCNLNNKNKNDAAIFLRHGVKNSIVANNLIDSPRAYGIVVASFEQNIPMTKNIVISSNIVSSNFEGIYLRTVKDIIVKGNSLSGKKIKHLRSYKKSKSSNVLIDKNL